jgi:hypothetical protein
VAQQMDTCAAINAQWLSDCHAAESRLQVNIVMLLQALNERKVEIRVQYKPPVQMQGGTVSLDAFRNELVMRCDLDCWRTNQHAACSICCSCSLGACHLNQSNVLTSLHILATACFAVRTRKPA